MGGKSQTIYSDNEGAFVSNEVQTYFKEEGIRHLTTLGHAPVAERQIRTMKDMIYIRVEHAGKTWIAVLPEVLLTYNNIRIHTITKMTPSEGIKQTYTTHNNIK